MMTPRSIQRFVSGLLVVCSAVALGVSLYFDWWNVFLVWWLIVISIFATSFIMELFHITLADPVLWLVARLERRRAKRKMET